MVSAHGCAPTIEKKGGLGSHQFATSRISSQKNANVDLELSNRHDAHDQKCVKTLGMLR